MPNRCVVCFCWPAEETLLAEFCAHVHVTRRGPHILQATYKLEDELYKLEMSSGTLNEVVQISRDLHEIILGILNSDLLLLEWPSTCTCSTPPTASRSLEQTRRMRSDLARA